jgi:pimeloyl-ACP methyl ester carboxylesterase
VPTPTSIRTADGSTLGAVRSGQGPPLVLVHGGMTDHRCFELVLPLLAERFAVTAYDRRGHGLSRELPVASMQEEIADLRAVVDAVGDDGGACVLGYSYGALVALEAVRRHGRGRIRAVVAYEPPYAVPGMLDALDAIVALVQAGRHEDAARTFLRESIHVPPPVIDLMATHPTWPDNVDLARHFAAESADAMGTTVGKPEHDVPPIRVLVAEAGGNPAFRTVAEQLRDRMGAEVTPIPGLPHFAMPTAPEAFASAVLDHLGRLHPPG